MDVKEKSCKHLLNEIPIILNNFTSKDKVKILKQLNSLSWFQF